MMSSKVADRRSYRQFCGLARALDVLGERWTLLLVRELLLGPRRYGDLLESLPGLTTNLLARRLKQLEADGIAERIELDASAKAYRLTERGAALEPVIMELGRWGGALLDMPRPEDKTDMAWGLISMKRRFKGGKNFRAQLNVGERSFTLSFEDDYLSVKQKRTDAPQLEVSGDPIAFRKWLFMGAKLDDLAASEELRVVGNQKARTKFIRAFERVS
jgi:DNA-binding HxlR family transcriptional regulator